MPFSFFIERVDYVITLNVSTCCEVCLYMVCATSCDDATTGSDDVNAGVMTQHVVMTVEKF
jgi:hypothetical protein